MAKTDETTTQPADNKTTSTAPEPQIFTIESLKEKFNIQDSIFAAVKISKGWAEGKQVSEKEFNAAVDTWLNAPINKGKEVK